MDYFEALRLIAQPIRASHLPNSLEHMHRLLDALDKPQQAFPSIVVAGSVGKGTTCHQIAALMGDHVKVGLYTSPHIHSFRERFSINGRLISQPEFSAGVTFLQPIISQLDIHYSTFEMTTALALWWFRRQAVDIAVLEIGIGGRYDAVNTVSNCIGVITPIEREHAAMLGGTLTSIAQHKAGIIQARGYVIAAPQQSEVQAVLDEEAHAQQATMSYEPIDTLALAVCKSLMQRHVIPDYPLPARPPEVHLIGRMEHIASHNKNLLIDGAHTLNSARRLRAEIERHAPTSTVHLIIGMLRDKSAQEFLTVFDDPRFIVTLTQTSSHRSMTTDELIDAITLDYASVIIQPDLSTAISSALSTPAQLIVITGSLRMAALSRELLGILDPDEYEEAQATRIIFEGTDYLTKLV